MKNYLLFACLLLTSCLLSQEKKQWTIMYYAAGSNSSEEHLMSDIDEMKRGKISTSYHFITLVDRIAGYSEDSLVLDGNFADTRLYEIEHNAYSRLSGNEFFPEMDAQRSYEANMADAHTLKRFIQYCKKYYPAHHYLLVLRSHGSGVSMCADAESGTMDRLYPAEISAVLTEEESVDILGLDVCSMAGLENLYEWRPRKDAFSATYVIASAPLSGAWAYDIMLSRVTNREKASIEDNYFGKGKEQYLSPQAMSPLAFSQLIMEEIYDQQAWASWGLFDNTKISKLKNTIDDAAPLLAKEDRKVIIDIVENSLAYHHQTSSNIEIAQLTFPYIDAYHFWSLLSQSDLLKQDTRDKAAAVCQSIDALVIHSYYGRGFLPETDDFINGKGGVYQIIPQGHKLFSQTKNSYWSHSNWFHPADQTNLQNAFGQYDWCIDGATEANNKVENFYEYLDFLFDGSNDSAGGVNAYQW